MTAATRPQLRRRWRAGSAALALALVAAAPAAASARTFHEHRIVRGDYRLVARDYPGRGPAFVLLHGFPDNLHLYDRLVTRLRGRRVVTFDFLGWGRSDKPQRRRYTFAGQEADLDAVITQLRLGRVELVGHDAGVPAAVNWALDHPERVASLAVMNGFYARRARYARRR